MIGTTDGKTIPPPPAITVLITHFGDQWIRGSEQVVLDLVSHLDPARIRPVIWTNVSALAALTERLGLPTYRNDFRVYFDHNSRRFEARTHLGLIRAAVEIIRRENVVVLHANSAAPAQWLAPAAWRTRRPLLVHLHAPYLRRSRAVLLIHGADRLVGVSEATLAGPRADGAPEKRLTRIYNGIDIKRLADRCGPDLRAQIGVPDQAFLLGGIGSLIRRKGWDVMLDAMRLLDPPVHLCVGGDGPEEDALRVKAADLGLSGRVHWLGRIDDPGRLYRAADAVVLSSRMEALPLSLLEAQACARAVVASAVGGVPEIIEDGRTGFLVPPEDPVALAAAIARLIDDSALRTQMGESARSIVAARFSADRMASQFSDLYADLAAHRPRLMPRLFAACRAPARMCLGF